jgi:hypothetical protein
MGSDVAQHGAEDLRGRAVRDIDDGIKWGHAVGERRR